MSHINNTPKNSQTNTPRNIDGVIRGKALKKTHQKSHTLHRKSVSKPSTPKKAPSKTVVKRTTTSQSAQTHARSPRIGKFADDTKLKPQSAPLAVHQPKAAPPVYSPNQTPATSLIDKHFDSIEVGDQEKLKKKPLLPFTKILTIPSVLVAVLIAGFVIYQQVPAVSMRLAAGRAGFDARLPETPAGFKVNGPIAFASGKVVINFSSNTDQRNASLTQQQSNLDSESLEVGELQANDVAYTEHVVGGQQVFIYDTSSATWVSGGVRYTLDGESGLSTTQILELVSSI
ncbi:MAG: hypothetical protein AAF413_03225 [Patescibacteria group bacterium]